MEKIKMIIDCDTGVDDALAITYILANQEIDCLGITTTFGNVDVDLAAKNSLLISELFQRRDIKVYKGAAHSCSSELYQRHVRSHEIHGHNGIGDVDLGEPEGKAEDQTAVDFIIDCARKYEDQLHLVFVGPLTNLAECIKKDIDAMKKVGNITIMGGALTVRGNASVYSEANIHSDIVAAASVFSSSIHLNIIPLDVTLKTLFKVSDIKEWLSINEAGRKLYGIARYYYVNEIGDENIGGAMHDPLAAYASFDPSVITNWFDCNLCVEDNGRIIGSFEELNLPEKRHHVALDVDGNRFTQDYIRLVSQLIREQ